MQRKNLSLDRLVDKANKQIFSAEILEQEFKDAWLWTREMVKELVWIVRDAETVDKEWMTSKDYKTKLSAIKTIAVMTGKMWPSAALVDAFKMMFWLHWVKSWDSWVNVNLNFTKLLYWNQ